jgi:hypothetical protein
VLPCAFVIKAVESLATRLSPYAPLPPPASTGTLLHVEGGLWQHLTVCEVKCTSGFTQRSCSTDLRKLPVAPPTPSCARETNLSFWCEARSSGGLTGQAD